MNWTIIYMKLESLQINSSTSESEASQKPPRAVDQKNSLAIASDKRPLKNHKKATHGEQASETLSRREVVSQSDDSAIDVQNHEKVTHGEKASVVSGQSPPKSNEFFLKFVCNYLLKRADAGDYIELRENPPVLHWRDLDKISDIYCDYKDQKTTSGKKLNREKKNRLDNIKNTIKLYEKGQAPSLTRVGSGTMYGKEFLACEIKDSALWCSLKRSFRLMEQQNSRANQNGPSSDTSGLDASQSDGQLYDETHESIRSSHTEVSQPEDQLAGEDVVEGLELLFDQVLNEQPNSGGMFESGDPLFHQTGETSQQLPTAVDEEKLLTIVPDNCSVEGGCSFIIHSKKDLPSGAYSARFADYGICKAFGSGKNHLHGSDKIPAATIQGTHWIEGEVTFNDTGERIGVFSFMYKDTLGDLLLNAFTEQEQKISDGSDPDNSSDRPTKKSSSDPVDGAGSNKRFRSCPIHMPMLVYLCDEMAKRGNKHFFSALIKFGIMGKVLENRCEYFNDFAITAREHGHRELAETIATSSRDVCYDQLMETLTFGELLDAVQTERSLENSDSVHSSDSDDPNSCSSGYNGDSEDCNGVHSTYIQENSAGQSAPSSQIQDSNRVHITHQENSTGQSGPSSQIRDQNEEKKSEDDVSHDQDSYGEENSAGQNSLSSQAQENISVVNTNKESWRDEVLKKLDEVFKGKAQDLGRILHFLDEEDKAYQDTRPYAPHWEPLKATVKSDKAFRGYAKRLSDETRRADNDPEFRRHMNVVYEQMLSHCEETVSIYDHQKADFNQLLKTNSTSTSALVRALNIIPADSKVCFMNCMKAMGDRTMMTAVDDVVGVASKTGGTVVMVGLAAVYLTYAAYTNIQRWWKGKISGERCIKNLLDSTLAVGAGIGGGSLGALVGTAVAGPIGAVVGGIFGSLFSAAGVGYLSDLMTQRMFGLPKEEALENAYRYLGVNMTASNVEINTAFRKLCLKHHPDKGGKKDDFFILQCNMAIIKQVREDF